MEGHHQSHRISFGRWLGDGGHGQLLPMTRSRAGATRMTRKTTPSTLIGMLSFSPISLARASSACIIAERMAADRARELGVDLRALLPAQPDDVREVG